jgi:hypothetical protein
MLLSSREETNPWTKAVASPSFTSEYFDIAQERPPVFDEARIILPSTWWLGHADRAGSES